MKMLHLSDLHLGKRVFEMSMLDEQRRMLDWAFALSEQADVTLIAGDVYDRPVPPAEAVALFDAFLTRMHAHGRPVCLIAGNHDSAERIAFASHLLSSCGVNVSPVYGKGIARVAMRDEFGPVNIWLLPFVKPSHVRAALGDEEIEGYTEALRAAIAAMEIPSGERNVLVAHQFVTGAQRSESEEVFVGGLDNVEASVFAPFDYTALGHLHSAQSLACGSVRYSGSPLCYAFSECGGSKGALMVEMDEKGEVKAELIPYTPAHALKKIRGTFAQITDPATAVPSEDYIQATLTDEDDVPDAISRLRALYPNILQLLYDNARTRAGLADFSGEALAMRRPAEWFSELYEMQNDAPLDETDERLLSEMIEAIWEEERHETA